MTNTIRRLSAIMFTDIVGYTALMQENEPKAAKVRHRHRAVFEDMHRKHHGNILQYFGDGTLSVFQSGVQAVECAIEIQQLLQSGELPIPLRIGLHLGDIVHDGIEIYGDGVNVASRIESMSVAGAVLLSSHLHQQLLNQPHIATLSLGQFDFKNVSQPLEIFAIANQGVIIPKKSELIGKGKPSSPTKSIAVLPFVNMSANEENEYFSDGMTEEIINALSKIKNLKVTSRTSSFYFKKKSFTLQQIAKELNVSTILEGSVRLAGNKIRITAQLIDVEEDIHFWSETFDRSIVDIFAVQDEISLLIAERLREQLGHLEIEAHLVESWEIPVEAYKEYLKARYHIMKMNKLDINKGLSILIQLLEEYPSFTHGHLLVHLGYTLMGTIGLAPASQAFVEGKKALDRAFSLQPELPECQIQLAWIAFLQEWDPQKAYEHLNKVAEYRDMVEYYQGMASILVAERKYSAAHHYLASAFQLDPFSEINHHLKGFILYVQGKYEEAIHHFEKSHELKRSFYIPLLYWGQALLCLKKPEAALALFEHMVEEKTRDLIKLGGTTMAQAALGNKLETELGIKTLNEKLQTDFAERAIYFLILSHTISGGEEEALNLLAKGISWRLPLFIYLPVEPLLNPLYDQERFKNSMKQILGEVTVMDTSPRKYQQSLFTEAELATQKLHLSEYMEQEKPYLDPTLTLRSLAQLLQIPPNHLSQLLNEGIGQNFSEFVNAYRLATFKEKVADPACQHLTILGLAFESGFNSKTVFNTYFKKMVGKTPREYWKGVMGQ